MDKKEFNRQLGAKIKTLRINSGMSQRDVATLLELRAPWTIMKYEQGVMGMPVFYLLRLLRKTNQDILEFLNSIIID